MKFWLAWEDRRKQTTTMVAAKTKREAVKKAAKIFDQVQAKIVVKCLTVAEATAWNEYGQ